MNSLRTFWLLFFVILLSSCSAEPRGSWKDQVVKVGAGIHKLCDHFVKFVDPVAPYILKIIQEIKSHMHEGIPSIGIPPLDPLNIPRFDFQIQKRDYKFKGQLNQISVINLSTFEVTDIDTDALNLAANISLYIPELSIRGNYDAKGKVFGFIPIYGKGPFAIQPVDVTIKISAVGGLKDDYIFIKSLNFKVDMKKLHTRFEGIYGGGPLGYVSKEIINSMGLTLFRQLEPRVHQELRSLLIVEINKALKGVKFADMKTGAMMPCKFEG